VEVMHRWRSQQQRERRESAGPYLDGPVEGSRSEGVGILGVEGELHDVVGVALKHLHTLPVLLPVPQLDEHVIGGRDHERLRRVDRQATDVIWCTRWGQARVSEAALQRETCRRDENKKGPTPHSVECGRALHVTLMGLKLGDLLHGVVVVDANHHVIGTTDHPLLARNEPGRTHCTTSRHHRV
jgi:hypothetical protein